MDGEIGTGVKGPLYVVKEIVTDVPLHAANNIMGTNGGKQIASPRSMKCSVQAYMGISVTTEGVTLHFEPIWSLDNTQQPYTSTIHVGKCKKVAPNILQLSKTGKVGIYEV